MNRHGPNGLITNELETTCAQEPIHQLGTVQSYEFLMVLTLDTGRIVQVWEGSCAMCRNCTLPGR